MKIVVLMRTGRLDAGKLAADHPDHEFVQIETADDLARALVGAEALVTSNSSYTEATARDVKASGVRWIQFTTSGIDLALRFGGFRPGTLVANGAGLAAPMVAEHAFALMLAIGHRLADAADAAAQRAWRRHLKDGMFALYGKTICIVGLGAVGREAARRARAFGMTVTGVSRRTDPVGEVQTVYPRRRLPEAVAQADVVLLSANADSETANMVDARALAAMKPGAILVNVARGELVDEAALVEACRRNRLAGVGLDVTAIEPLPPDSPLWTLPNVVITPHVAGGGADNSDLIRELVGENIRRYAAGRPLRNAVDWQHIVLA